MSVLKFLTRISNGTIELVSAITSSAGGADANKVIATNASGKLDATLLPPGVEIQVETMTTSEDITAGDFVNIYDNAGTRTARKAVANDATKIACGFVLASSTTGNNADVYTKGVNTAVAGEESTKYYLSSTTPGASTSTAPTDTSGHFQQVLGIGVGTGILFEFDDPIYFA